VTADVTVLVGVGEISVDGRTTSGFGVPDRRERIEQGDGSELVTLDVSVGFGEARVDTPVETHDPPPDAFDGFDDVDRFGQFDLDLPDSFDALAAPERSPSLATTADRGDRR
jgi:hypothetical protein